MAGPAPAEAAPGDSRLTEALLRVFALLTYGLFLSNIVRAWWVDPGRITLLLLLVNESLTLLLLVFARRAVVRDMSLLSTSATIYACTFVVRTGGKWAELATDTPRERRRRWNR